jgi:O-antigen/teichoic acid export membrane protein
VLSFGLAFLLGVASTIGIARVYGIAIVGGFALANAPVVALQYLSTVREQAGLVKEMAKLEARDPRVTALFYAVFAFSLALTALVAGIGTLVVYFVFNGGLHKPSLFGPAVVGLLAYTVLQNTCWNLDMVFSSFRAGRQLFWARTTQNVAFVVIAVLGGLVWPTVWMLVIATALQWLVALLHRLFVMRRFMVLRVSRSDLRWAFRQLPGFIAWGIKLAVGTLAGGVGDQAGVWILGYLVPVSAVGAYNRATQLANRFVDGNIRVYEMLFPTLVERLSEGDQDGIDRVVVDSTRYTVAAWLLIAAGGGGAAEGIMRTLGPGFGQAARSLTLLLIMPVFGSIASIGTQLLTAHSRLLLSSAVTGSRLIIILATSIPLVDAFGITGAALGLLAGYLLDVVVRARLISRYLSRPFHRLWGAREVLGLACSYAVSFGVSRLVDRTFNDLPGTILALAAGSIAFIVSLIATRAPRPIDWERLRRLRVSAARSAS